MSFPTYPSLGRLDFIGQRSPAAQIALTYTSGNDFGFSNGGGPNGSNPTLTQRRDLIIPAILRFDPRSPSVTRKRNGLGDCIEQRRELRVEEARRLLRNGRLRGGSLKELDPLLAVILDGRVKDEFTYPVVVCDHDDRRSVTDGLSHGR
jgi:hypothetical protein